MKLTAVSLFAGVGGFDLALERSGVEVVAAVEIDAQARSVLARRFPNTQLFNDVTEVTGDQLLAAGFTPEQGILCGGFPCQDLSVAGKRAGLDGERSGLFFEIVRFATELQPKWLILENVPGLLSSNGGRDMGTVLGALADCGYGFAYRVLDAQHFGVPQRRRRVFIVGHLGDDGRAPGEVLALSQGVRGHLAKGEQAGQETAGRVAGSLGITHGGDDLDRMTFVPVGDITGTLSGGGTSGRLQRSGRLQQPTRRVYGQTGFAKYSEGEVKTLSATNYKRAEDNLVVG